MATKKGKSATYYKNAPASVKRKKAATDKAINARKEQKVKRAESNAKRAAAKKKGQNIEGKDWDHATNRFVKSATNRGRAGEGGRKKKK